MEKIKLYAVNSGCYSDYGIHSIFSSIELANEYMVTFPRDGYDGYNDVEIYELDPYQKQIKEGLTLFEVTMYVDGKFKIINVNYPNSARVGIPRFISMYRPKMEMVYCTWAKDEQHAIKVTNEIRLHKIASDTWGIN